MYCEIAENDMASFKEIEDMSIADYDIKGNLVSVDSLYSMVLDLLNEVHIQQEIREDLEEDMRENYEPKKFDPYLEYGLHENDFH